MSRAPNIGGISQFPKRLLKIGITVKLVIKMQTQVNKTIIPPKNPILPLNNQVRSYKGQCLYDV